VGPGDFVHFTARFRFYRGPFGYKMRLQDYIYAISFLHQILEFQFLIVMYIRITVWVVKVVTTFGDLLLLKLNSGVWNYRYLVPSLLTRADAFSKEKSLLDSMVLLYRLLISNYFRITLCLVDSAVYHWLLLCTFYWTLRM
jgi:hypothetical protein